MAEASLIEWTDSTWNPWVGCTKVSPGCDHCYAEFRMDIRLHFVRWGIGQPRQRTSAENWKLPHRWNKAHERFFAKHQRRQRVFCASLADVFDNEVPIEWLVDVLKVWRATPHLDKLVLTKRIGNAQKRLTTAFSYICASQPAKDDLLRYVAAWLDGSPPVDVWLGATVVNQEEADRDIPKLLAMPAHVRFLSMEPLLGPVQLDQLAYATIQHSEEWTLFMNALTGFHATSMQSGMDGPKLDWVIVGGESGHGARPFHVNSARRIVHSCQTAGVPVFVKQIGAFPAWNGCSDSGEHWPSHVDGIDTGQGFFRMKLTDAKGGDWLEWPTDLRVRQFPEVTHAALQHV